MVLIDPMPAAEPSDLFTFRQLLESGLDVRDVHQRVRRHELCRVRRGVYVDGELWDSLDEFTGRPLLRIHAAHLTITSPHAFSHDSAALLFGLGVPDARASYIHLTRSKVTGTRIQAGVKHHGAPTFMAERTHLHNIPVLSLARTACDMAREHGSTYGTAVCSQALRAGATGEQLSMTRRRMRNWPGVHSVERAIDRANPLVESFLEGMALDLVHDLGLGRPECQFGLTDGHREVFADMRIRRHIFEVDGRAKYDLPGADPGDRLWLEKKRQDFVGGFKLGVSRITAYDCLEGRKVALRRLAREYADTCARFGTEIRDLAPYTIKRGG